jgi:hypothetical protein
MLPIGAALRVRGLLQRVMSFFSIAKKNVSRVDDLRKKYQKLIPDPFDIEKM